MRVTIRNLTIALGLLALTGCASLNAPRRPDAAEKAAASPTSTSTARASFFDRFRLSRAFKEAFGLPPHAYLIQLRLARARQLLGRGLAPAQVAADLGFADQSHLGRWFRRAYGVTPAYYRQRCSKLPD